MQYCSRRTKRLKPSIATQRKSVGKPSVLMSDATPDYSNKQE